MQTEIPAQFVPAERRSLLFFAADTSNAERLQAYHRYFDAIRAMNAFDLTVMAPNGSPFASFVRDAGIALYPASDFSRKLLRRTPQLWPILTATRRYRFDVALSHDGFACRGLKQISRHLVGICHDDNVEAFGAADRIVVPSSGLADRAREALGSETDCTILSAPYRCKQSRIKPLPKDGKPITIGTNSAFIEGDGLGSFIHTAQLVHQALPDVHYVVAGDGPCEHDMKELADQIAPFIDFAGPLDEAEMIEQFDIYCMTMPQAPSAATLYPMMDAGLVCVATSTDGAMDVLQGGMVAPLVGVDDAFALAVQLQDLIEHPAQMEQIKEACFARIREEDFSQGHYTDSLSALLNHTNVASSL